MDTYAIALVGWGTVGSGVVELIRTQSDLLRERCGLDLRLKYIVEKDLTAAIRKDPAGAQVTDDLRLALRDAEVRTVLELVGGTGVAREIALAVLESGRNLVTANKALLAHHGPALFACARASGVTIGFEASVGGGIPIIQSLRDGLVANRIQNISGILNGTCNFILTKMEEESLPFAEALRRAQSLGYAEADPRLDINGSDTAHKLAILATIAHARAFDFNKISLEGIDCITPEDIRSARHLDYRIKLLGVASPQPNGLVLRVSPTLVPLGHPLAEVRDNFNAIFLHPHAAGPILLVGQGAGGLPTASAVLSDIIDLASTSFKPNSRRLRLFEDASQAPMLLSHIDEHTEGYVRFTVRDEAGVMARICQILSQKGISLRAVFQGPSSAGADPRIEVTVHPCRYGDLLDAVEQIDAHDLTVGPTRVFRIFSPPSA